MTIEIWHDNDFDLAHWVYKHSPTLLGTSVTFRQIPKTNNPTDLMRHLKNESDLEILRAIKYETPDLIITKIDNSENKSRILLVAEFMTHTPQHDHPLQRFTRIYGAAFQGIPSVLLIPAKKEKLEKGRRGTYVPVMYRANPLIRHLFIRTTQVTSTPTMLMLWPEHEGYLKFDKSHPTSPRVEGDLIKFFEVLENLLNGRSIQSISESWLQKEIIASGYIKPDLENYDLTTLFENETSELDLGISSTGLFNQNPKLRQRSKTIVYSPMGLNSGSSGFRTDPYAGKTCAFDVLFCRDDEGVRYKNLVLRANGIAAMNGSSPTLPANQHDESSCPFISASSIAKAWQHFSNFCIFTERKQTRVFGAVPDVVVYDGGDFYAKH